MNYTETFDQFATKLGPTDLALYAGFGIIIWILIKDKLSPVQQFLTNIINKTKNVSATSNDTDIKTDNIISNIFDTTVVAPTNVNKDVFFDLVISWKQTRDLAVKSGCVKAVEVADQMFPYLSPSVCQKEEVK